jgi:hypothetical protein
MLIELHIRRVNRAGVAGTRVPFPDKTVYQFEPDAEHGESHVCEVIDATHIKRLLSIREFTMFGDTPEAVEEESDEAVEIDDEVPSTDTFNETEEADFDLELDMCETIVGMNVTDARDELAALSDAALEKLVVMERAGAARTTLLQSIEDEQMARLEAEQEEAEPGESTE